jgi:hypothetical protein
MTKPTEFSYTTTPPRVAARFIFSDYWFFVSATLALAAVTFAQLEQVDPNIGTTLHLLSGLVCAAIQTAVTIRLVRFFNPEFKSNLTAVSRTILTGTVITVLSSAPAIVGAVGGTVNLNYLLLTLPAYLIYYLGFFYFAPMLLCAARDSSIRTSFAIVKAFPAAPVRVMIPAAAISTLLSGLVGLLSPDGREPFYNAGLAVASALGDSAGFYLAAAYGAWFVSKIPGNSAPTERQFVGSELETTNASGDLMSLKTAGILLLAGIALNFGNFGQSAGLEPAVRVTLVNSNVQDSSVTLELKLSDEKYQFRGFQPIALALAGPNRGAISLPPELTSLSGNPITNQNFRFQLPRSSEPITVTLKFETSRTAADLKLIEDLHLWYKNVKLFKLDLGEKLPTPQS